MRPRTILFWMHLCSGVVAGTIVLIMSVTGVLLAYQRQLSSWAERSYRTEPPPSSSERLAPERLLAELASARPDIEAESLTFRSDPAEPVVVGLSRGQNLYVSPVTGDVLGEGAPRARGFFRTVTDWHRWLGMSGEGRQTGRTITGACNLAFLFLVASGFYLWWPRTLRMSAFRNVSWFRGGLRGKAREFNWHNVIGFWSAVPLFVIVLGGVVISYPWASDLVYRFSGSEPPETRGSAKRPGDVRKDGAGDDTAPWLGLDSLLVRAASEFPAWQSIVVRKPDGADEPMSFAVDMSAGGQPAKRATLTLDRSTCDVVSLERYEDQSSGRRARLWLRFAHTGEVYGVIGQTVAGAASLGAIFLVYTGLTLSWRRLFQRKA